MKTNIRLILVGLLVSVWCDLSASVTDSTKLNLVADKSLKKSFIKMVTYRKVEMLELRPGFNFLHHTYLLGDVKITDSGIYFTPRVEAPEGVPELSFERRWWYNSLFKELYIPYTDIKNVKSYVRLKIRTKDGRRFKIVSRNYKQYEAEIKSHLK